MTTQIQTTTETPEVAARKARLAEVSDLLEATRTDERDLQDERDALCRSLKAEGVPRAELADLGKVTVENLKWILSDRSRKGRRSS